MSGKHDADSSNSAAMIGMCTRISWINIFSKKNPNVSNNKDI
jgi:hypothetical protein